MIKLLIVPLQASTSFVSTTSEVLELNSSSHVCIRTRRVKKHPDGYMVRIIISHPDPP